MNLSIHLKKLTKVSLASGLLLFTLSSVCISCGTKLNPKSPQEEYKSALASTKELSFINVPVTVDLNELQQKINTLFPSIIYEDSSFTNNDGDDLKLKITKFGDVSITHLQEDVFRFVAPVSVTAVKKVSALGFSSNASTTFEMKISFDSQIYPTSQWGINTTSTPAGFEFISEPKLRVAGISIPGKALIANVIENYQGLIARKIDEAVVDNLNLEPLVLDLWNEVKTPRLLDAEYDLWAAMDPQDFLITPLVVDKVRNQLRLTFVMKTYLNTFVGKPKQINIKESTSLPPLKFVTTSPGGFRVEVDNMLSFEQAEKIAQSTMMGETFYSEDGKYKVVVNGIELFGGTNNKLVIKTAIEGSVNGTVFLSGVPSYNEKGNFIELDDLDFHIKTKSVLVKSAAWLLESKFRRVFEENLKLPLDELIGSVYEGVNNGFKTLQYSNMAVNGNLLSFKPHQISIEENGIRTRFWAVGEVELKINSKI